MSDSGTEIETALINSRPVKTQGHIPVPREVRDVIGVSGEGSVTFWNYHQETEYVVLSNQSLNSNKYEFVDLSEFYEEKQNGDRDIRPPGKLPERIQSYFRAVETDKRDRSEDGKILEENRVFFLATSEMVEQQPYAVYLLNTEQMADLLTETPFISPRNFGGGVSDPDARPRYVNLAGERIAYETFRRRKFEQEETLTLKTSRQLPRPE